MLVLSDRAGAASELTDALLVNPYDTHSISCVLRQALDMPHGERCARHERLLAALREHDIHAWRSRFVAMLVARGDARFHARVAAGAT